MFEEIILFQSLAPSLDSTFGNSELIGHFMSRYGSLRIKKKHQHLSVHIGQLGEHLVASAAIALGIVGKIVFYNAFSGGKAICPYRTVLYSKLPFSAIPAFQALL